MTDPESRDLHQGILTTAQGLFIERGYHGLAMRQIAEALGVTKPALYYHFKDKESLFLAVLEVSLQEIEALVDQVTAEADSCAERLRLLVTRILSLPPERRAMIRLASQELVHLSAPARAAFEQGYQERFIAKVERIIRSGVASGELRRLEPGIATWALLGMMYPYFYANPARELPLSAEIAPDLLAIYLHGVLAG